MSIEGRGPRNKTDYRDGGTRGGRTEFKWDSVKTEKYRENYLGHSIMAPVGRWQRGKDLTWFSKGKAEQSKVAADERARIIAMEKQMRAERLGFVPKTRRDPVGKLVEHELEVLKRGNLERDQKEMASNRVDGLGGAEAPKHAAQDTAMFSGPADDTLPGTMKDLVAASHQTDSHARNSAMKESSRKRKIDAQSTSGQSLSGSSHHGTSYSSGEDSGKNKRRKSKKSDKQRSKKRKKRKKKKKKKNNSDSASAEDLVRIMEAIRQQEQRVKELQGR